MHHNSSLLLGFSLQKCRTLVPPPGFSLLPRVMKTVPVMRDSRNPLIPRRCATWYPGM